MPPPPPVARSQAEFRDAALKMGVGDCSDLRKIKAAPHKSGRLGADPYWDRILVHAPSYRACLVEAVGDRRRPAHDISFGPGLPAQTAGDVAHALLVEAGFIAWATCLPPAVARSAQGAVAARDWLAQPAHRTAWEMCLQRALAPG